MDLVNLVKLIVAWEQGEEGQDFEVDAADTPVVHLLVVVAVSEQALWGSVPPSGDVLREWGLGVDSTAGPEVSQLDHIVFDENVLRLDVSVKNAIAMHVVDRLQHLVHVVPHPLLGQVVSAAFNGFIKIHVHKFKYKG